MLKVGVVALVLNEIRGLVLAVPVLWGMYEAGGTLMAIWLGLCSLGGIALSVIIPAVAANQLRKRIARNSDRAPASRSAVPAQ